MTNLFIRVTLPFKNNGLILINDFMIQKFLMIHHLNISFPPASLFFRKRERIRTFVFAHHIQLNVVAMEKKEKYRYRCTLVSIAPALFGVTRVYRRINSIEFKPAAIAWSARVVVHRNLGRIMDLHADSLREKLRLSARSSRIRKSVNKFAVLHRKETT